MKAGSSPVLLTEECLSVGALFKVFPVGRVKKVLRDLDKASIRERAMPNYILFYYVLMLALFMKDGYREVMRRLLEGVKHARRGQDKISPLGKSGISQARSRLGSEPFKQVYDQFVGPVAQPTTRGAWYKDWLLVSLDGSTLDVADSLENQEEFGIQNGDRGRVAFPKIRFVTLMENGTRVMFGAAFGSYCGPDRVSEMDLSWEAIKGLKPGMLCLADRFFLGFKLWKAAAAAGSHLLWRVKNRHIFEPHKILSDGSYLSKIYPSTEDRIADRDGVTVRVIEYKFKLQQEKEIYRLITTVLDHELAPAEELAGLYHERWTIETAFAELKTSMRGGDVVLRSKTPDLVKQEFYAFLLAYFAVRGIMHEAALAADEDPGRLSFVHSINVIRRKLPAFGTFPPAALG